MSFGPTDYDADAVGWKVAAAGVPYDTTQVGYSNAGHTFGDDLSEADRRALLEYLKTL
jgi:hypothetical protein